MNLALVGLYDCNNFGDPILAKCTEWLYSNSIYGENIAICKRLVTDAIYLHVRRNPSFMERVVQYLLRRFGFKFFFERYLYRATYRYFRKELTGMNAVVFVGGGIIKYKAQYFWLFVPAIIKAAEKLNISVFFNAVGVEGYDANDYRCRHLKKALSSKCVKHISTRDDFKTLHDNYFDTQPCILLTDVADPAVWTKEVYSINIKDMSQNKNTIGIGVARGDIFRDYGIYISPEFVYDLYFEIALVLIKKGYQVEIYTNGAGCDEQMAFNVHKRLKDSGYDVSIKIPTSPEKLINQISFYKGIIATRLHSSIIAYSLNIPAIGLVWNDKQRFFGKKIHSEEYFIQSSEFVADVIVERLDIALKRGYDLITKQVFRDTIVEDINSVKKILTTMN